MSEAEGMDRRDMIRRSAVVAGAALYAVPVVQVIAMSSASAAVASGPPPLPTPPGKQPTEVLPVVLDRGVPTTRRPTDGQLVGQGGAPSSLPFTGNDVQAAAALAAAVLAAGAATTAAARRSAAGPTSEPASSSDQSTTE